MSELGTVSVEGVAAAGSVAEQEAAVLTCGELPAGALGSLLGRFGLTLVEVGAGERIPGSFWGEPEAGVIRTSVYVRPNTPVHSALHEACHLICADGERRETIDTDVGGGYDEEDAVCYLQLLLAEHLPGPDGAPVGRERLAADMDRWGYTFRLGSTLAWFEGDAEDARGWLVREGLVDGGGEIGWRLRA